ncbi:hypothetical protein [Thermomonospora amylolytica]|uniref:hypothetical protein n=1 Tax=Thermomonospora amylolytica TaxID=1411117 RepID=UPI0013003708|nr:hypothetical protein [Thermomonospora amylolytica]
MPEGRDVLSSFVLVHFGLTPQEKEELEAWDRSGWTGHPQNAFWFCREHAELAQSRTGLHWRDALASIDAVLGR